MKNKIFIFILVLIIIIPVAVFVMDMIKSKDDPQMERIVNIGLNPKVEFILDKDNKVTTVNALNEDGNRVISLAIDEVNPFEGKNIDDALDLFLQIAKDNGYLITGSQEKLTIDASGDSENMLVSLNNKAKQFFTTNNINCTVMVDIIEKQDIMNEIRSSMLEYKDSELELSNMTEEQLIDLLKSSREETKNMLTQELKEVYYNLRDKSMDIAELKTLFEITQDLVSLPIVNSFNSYMQALFGSVTTLEQSYVDILLDAESTYGQAKSAYITAKENLLTKRLEFATDGFSETELTQLNDLESVANNALTALEQAKTQANSQLQTTINNLNEKISDALTEVETVKNALTIMGRDLESLSNALAQVKEQYNASFTENANFTEFFNTTQWN